MTRRAAAEAFSSLSSSSRCGGPAALMAKIHSVGVPCFRCMSSSAENRRTRRRSGGRDRAGLSCSGIGLRNGSRGVLIVDMAIL